jgi:hypothetical protein
MAPSEAWALDDLELQFWLDQAERLTPAAGDE